MSESKINEVSMERLLRVRGILIEEYDSFFSKIRSEKPTEVLDTMDILLYIEEIVMPSLSDRLQKLYSKEKKLEIMQAAEEEDACDDSDE